MIPLYVPDASVILSFLLDEEDGEFAKKFFADVAQEKINILLPDIYFYELSNRLGKPKNNIEKEDYFKKGGK